MSDQVQLKYSQEEINAIQVLINAALLAQSKGAFSLKDSSLIHDAVRFFVPETAQEDAPQSDEGEEVKEAS